MNGIFSLYFFLTYFVFKVRLQTIQYKDEIENFLSQWNTSFNKTIQLKSDERYEDIESIFGPYNSANVSSFLDNESYDENELNQKSPIYKLGPQESCKSDIVIQQRTILLEELNFLLPYRSVVFISCRSNRLPSISIRHGVYYTKIEADTYKSYIINSVDMLPGTVFVVNNRTVLIESLESSAQIIASSNMYLNIANKKNLFDPLQFSYKSEILQNATKLYANSLPFSQTFFTQIYVMGSFLDTTKIPTDEDRKLPASFNDLMYCSQDRQCNGSFFIGRNDTPFSFLREDALEDVYNSTFNLITAYMDKFRYRQMVSQRSQFENDILKTGITFNEGTVFISETENDFIKENIQKEVSHALGHTYNLLDNSGPADITQKAMYYYLDFSLNIISPFDNSTRYASTGAMNGAVLTKDIYPRFNIFSTNKIYNLMKNSSIIPEKVQNSLINGGSTLFIVNRFQDYFLFKTNIDTLKDVNVSTTKCDGCETEIEVYETTEKKNPSIFYLNTTEAQKLPDTWLNSSNFIIVKNKNLEKLFYLPDEAKEMALPIAGIVPESYLLIPAYRKGVQEVEPRINNFWLLNSIPEKKFKNQDADDIYLETVDDYKRYFVNTSYISFLPYDTYWKSIIYLPDILMNETKIIYFYTNALYNFVLMYKNDTNSFNNVTMGTKVDTIKEYVLSYKKGIWSNNNLTLNYSDVNTTDLFINKISPFNIVYLNVSGEFDNIKIPSSDKFDNIILVLNTVKDIYAQLIINYNEGNILLKKGKNLLTYIKTGWATVNPNTDIHC